MNEYKLLTYTVNWSPTRVAGAFGAKICGKRSTSLETMEVATLCSKHREMRIFNRKTKTKINSSCQSQGTRIVKSTNQGKGKNVAGA